MTEERQRLNILFVDDEKQILIPLKALFKKQYSVFTASSGPKALEVIRNNPIQIIVSDQRMPEMQGVELLRQVKEISPSTVRILLTGYADLSAVMASVNTGEVFRFIEKPWNNERLKKTISAAADISLKQKTEPASDKANIIEAVLSKRAGLLLVDEDLEICAKVHHLFGHKHNVYCAGSLAEATHIVEHQDITVLITDTVIHGEETSYLIHSLKQTHPSVITVVLTTQADAHLIVRLINQGQIFRYLPKPVENHLLEFCINAALKRHSELQHQPTLLTVSQQSVEETPEEETQNVIKENSLNLLVDRLKAWRQRLQDFFRY